MNRWLFSVLFLFILWSIYSQNIEVTFPSDTLSMNGTLAIPGMGKPPFPVAILVHGSGPSDRDQSLTLSDGNSLCLYPLLFNRTIRNFKDISKHLSDNGIAVLRYDKRTFTHRKTLVEKEVRVSDFILDIESAIEYCRKLPTIDNSSIFLIGHSQGSGLIPIAAKNTEGVKGLISLSGASSPIDSLMPMHFRDLYVRCANDTVTGDDIAQQLYEQFKVIRNDNFPDDDQIMISVPSSPNKIPLGYGGFWKDWILLSENSIINYENASIKTLVIHGMDDNNIPVTEVDAFAGLTNTEIKVYEGINHFLTPSNDPHVSVDILTDIIDWISSCISSSVEVKIDTSRIISER